MIFVCALTSFQYPITQAAPSSAISGKVIDAVTRQPIVNATIVVSRTIVVGVGKTSQTSTVTINAKTSANGSYRVVVDSGFVYEVYAYHLDPNTAGCDYVPEHLSVSAGKGGEAEAMFEMVPAASVVLSGDLLIVDSAKPTTWTYTVVSEQELAGLNRSILTYGSSASSQNSLINLNSSQVIVPANTPLKIVATTATNVTIVIDDPRFSYLEKGDVVQAEIARYTFPYNLKLTNGSTQFSENLAATADQKGFYVLSEQHDLAKASLLIENAQEEFAKGLYSDSYADLRQAYTEATYTASAIQSMYVSASMSVPLIIVFLAATSVALSYLLFEHWAKKILAAGLSYAMFTAIFYYVYAGCRIVDILFFLGTAAASISVVFLATFVLARLFPMTIVFSLAKRNIRRRTTRFILTLIPITVLVMSFVALTSFSSEYGFTSTAIGSIQTGTQGLLVRQHPPEMPTLSPGEVPAIIQTFTPFDASVMDWLQSKPEVTLVAPKVENMPMQRSLGSLSYSSNRLSIFGIIGVLPSAEAQTTSFDKLVVQGRYLSDDEQGAILISTSAAETLKVQVGENLTFTALYPYSLKLVGLFDDDALAKTKDLDGASIVPQKIVVQVIDGTVTWSMHICDPSEVVVANWQTASKLSSVALLSRIDVTTKGSTDLPQFAREIALERDYLVWADVRGTISLVGLTQYLEAEGTSIFLPWLIVILDVIVVMANAIYERRKEVAILSSIGLNPTHITSLFGAEALIIGVLGGGLGYFVGLSSYRVMALLSAGIVVREKVSFAWSLASMAISMSAVLIGAFVALRSSVIITPSLLRRWTQEKTSITGGELESQIPIRLREEELGPLLSYVKSRVQDHVQAMHSTTHTLVTKLTKESDEKTDNSQRKVIYFKYRFGREDPIGMFPFKLIAERKSNEEMYELRVTSSLKISERFRSWLRSSA